MRAKKKEGPRNGEDHQGDGGEASPDEGGGGAEFVSYCMISLYAFRDAGHAQLRREDLTGRLLLLDFQHIRSCGLCFLLVNLV